MPHYSHSDLVFIASPDLVLLASLKLRGHFLVRIKKLLKHLTTRSVEHSTIKTNTFHKINPFSARETSKSAQVSARKLQGSDVIIIFFKSAYFYKQIWKAHFFFKFCLFSQAHLEST